MDQFKKKGEVILIRLAAKFGLEEVKHLVLQIFEFKCQVNATKFNLKPVFQDYSKGKF